MTDRDRERWLAEIEARVDALQRETTALDQLILQEREREQRRRRERSQEP
jgi:gluconate kinase